MYSRRTSRIQKGQGFGDLLKIGKRLNKKYSKIAKATGADKLVEATLKTTVKTKLPTIEQKLKSAGVSEKIITPLSSMVNKQLGEGYMKMGCGNIEKMKYAIENPLGKEIYGTGFFDDLISTFAVLPIPGLSCLARTVALVKTAVDTATSDEPVKAFGGIVSDLGNTITNVLPPGLKQIGEAGVGLAESVGFGAIPPNDKQKIVKIGVKHIGDILDTIDTGKLSKNKKAQVDKAKQQVQQALPELNKMKVGSGNFYWDCANKEPSCKKLYDGMAGYHSCAYKKGCRKKEIKRKEALARMALVDRGVSAPQEQKQMEVKTQDTGTQSDLPLLQAPRIKKRKQKPKPKNL